MKTCRKCIVEKPFSEFSKNKSRKDGYCNYCKLCDREKVRKYHQTPEGGNKNLKRHRQNYKDRLREDPSWLKDRWSQEQDNLSQRYKAYKKRAKIKSFKFELTKEVFDALTSKTCYYCNEYTRGNFVGLDRVDNDKGYTEDNVIPCCKFCNYARRTVSREEFLRKVRQIVKNLGTLSE